MAFELVVFDWDGTLVDSLATIAGAMTAAFEAHGFAAPGEHLVREIVGLPLAESVRRLLPAGGPVGEVTESYRRAYAERVRRPEHREPLYPHAREVLDLLAERGLRLAIATGKSRRGLAASLARHDLADRFACLKTADDGPGKPAPDILLACLRELGCRPEEAVMVGDTTFDVRMGRAAGTAVLGAGWGFHPPAALRDAGAHLVLGALSEVPAALERFSIAR